MRSLFCISICLLLVPITCHAAEWYPGVIHLHTTFSDGGLPPSQLAEVLKAQGAKFMIVTDHYDQIGKPKKGLTPLAVVHWLAAGRLAQFMPDGPSGFDKYHSDVSELTTEGQFVAVPGAEIAALWNPEAGNQAEAHTLAIGDIRELDSQLMDEYSQNPDKQQNVIDKIRQWGMLPVAAHPSLLHNGTPGELSHLPGIGRIDYRYDKRPADQAPGGQVQYRGLAGVELWNAEKTDQTRDDIDFYLRLIQEGLQPFVTAGSDYHVLGPTDRITGVYADQLTTEGLLKAIGEGRTYAAQHGARIVSMSPSPGEHVTADKVTIRATIAFQSPTGSPKDFFVYRDGVEAPDSRQTKAKGAASYDYEWTDAQADGREHSYVLRVAEVLVTSPAYVTAAPATPASKDVLTFIKDGRMWAYDTSTKTQQVLPIPLDDHANDYGPIYEWSPTGEYLLWNGNTVIDRAGRVQCVLKGVDVNWVTGRDELIIVDKGRALIRTLAGEELYRTDAEDICYAGVLRDLFVAVHRRRRPNDTGDGEYDTWLSARRLTGGPVHKCPCPEFRFAKGSPGGPPEFSPDGSKFRVLQGFMHGSWYNWYSLDQSLVMSPIGKPGSADGPWAIGPDGSEYSVDTSVYSIGSMLDSPADFAPVIVERKAGRTVATLAKGMLPSPSYVPCVEVSPSGTLVAIEVQRATLGKSDLVPQILLWKPADSSLVPIVYGASQPRWLPAGRPSLGDTVADGQRTKAASPGASRQTGDAAPAPNIKSVRIVLNPKLAVDKLGDVEVVYGDGRSAKLTTGGNCSQAAVAADGRTVGWVAYERAYKEYDPKDDNLYPTRLVLWRDGQVLRRIPDKTKLDDEDWGLVDCWCFVQNGSQVAMGRGPRARDTKRVTLRDTVTGRLIDARDNPGYYVNAPKLPDWALPLGIGQ